MFDEMSSGGQRNVLGTPLALCSESPRTGFYRTGCCHTGPDDRGLHTVCVLLTAEFLAYTKSVGNDLSTPRPEYGFPGLLPGQRWCLCAARFLQAAMAGCGPDVVLAATNEKTLDVVPLEVLEQHRHDREKDDA